MVGVVETKPVGAREVDSLARLFDGSRNTRRCWCMAFCTTRVEFARGWVRQGNRRRFEAMATSKEEPMGVLACRDDEPVGWAACGPRSRYVGAGRSALPISQEHDDESFWLLPCLFVGEPHRGQGITGTLVRAAVDLARAEGATAIDGWPVVDGQGSAGDGFLGRASVFASVGFRVVDRPTPDRVLMRLDLSAP